MNGKRYLRVGVRKDLGGDVVRAEQHRVPLDEPLGGRDADSWPAAGERSGSVS